MSTAEPSPGTPACRARTANALPNGFACPGCGYDLSSTRAQIGDPCVECGRRALIEDVRVHDRVREVLDRKPSIVRRALLVWPTLVALYAGGAALCLSDLEETLAASAMLVLGVLLSLALGWGAAACGSSLSSYRRALFLAWLEHLWLLHAAWIVGAPVALACLLAVGAVTSSMDVVLEAAGVGFFAWLLGTATAAGLWVHYVSKRIGGSLNAGPLYGAAVLVVLGAGVIGVLAGVTAVHAAETWLSLKYAPLSLD